MTSDHGLPERERFLRPPTIVVLTTEEFGYWCAVFFGFGALGGILVASMLGWTI